MLTELTLGAVIAASAPVVGSAVSDWFDANGAAIVTALLIMVAAVIINFIVRRSIRLAVDRLVKTSESRRERAEGADEASGLAEEATRRRHEEAVRRERAEQRTRTVGSLLRYVATIAIYTVAILMALSELGLDIAPLIASAGIAGVALGFGAQSLVRDFLSGTFMLIEDQFGVGDVVDLGEASGTVERVTLRVTTVRGVDGTVWYVPNGQIVRVGNKSQRWARTVLDIEVAYDTDIQHASGVIKRVADEFWKERVQGATVIEEPELWGVENVGPNVVVLRLAVKTRPGEQWAAGRALRARLKAALDEAGIMTPLPVQTLWMPGGAAAGAATRGASAPGDDASPGGADAADSPEGGAPS
jgi:moderate conductance mechanosensitive channel